MSSAAVRAVGWFMVVYWLAFGVGFCFLAEKMWPVWSDLLVPSAKTPASVQTVYNGLIQFSGTCLGALGISHLLALLRGPPTSVAVLLRTNAVLLLLGVVWMHFVPMAHKNLFLVKEHMVYAQMAVNVVLALANLAVSYPRQTVTEKPKTT